eukprot:1699028-Rhodomonas_salina.2
MLAHQGTPFYPLTPSNVAVPEEGGEGGETGEAEAEAAADALDNLAGEGEGEDSGNEEDGDGGEKRAREDEEDGDSAEPTKKRPRGRPPGIRLCACGTTTEPRAHCVVSGTDIAADGVRVDAEQRQTAKVASPFPSFVILCDASS